MSEVIEHYESLLAQHYTWMLGEFDELVEEQRHLLESCKIDTFDRRDDASVALDLGCGSGIQSIALAQLGYGTVFSIDVSRTLLAELEARSVDYPAVRAIHADMSAGLDGTVEPQSITTAVCMGDTLPHLPDAAAVGHLFGDAFAALRPGGIFVLSFRDLTTRLSGLDRFIQLRADQDRIMTCFLEDEGDAVRVHDLVHVMEPDGTWRLHTSSYRKLRLDPSWVAEQLTDSGFAEVSGAPGPRGICLITARKPRAGA